MGGQKRMDEEMGNRRYKGVINYFVNYTSIFSLTPWRNSIRLFHEDGYKIRVYQFADERIRGLPTDLEDKYTLVEIRYPRLAKYILFVIKTLFRSLKHIGLKRLSTFGDGIDCLFRNYYFIAACLLKSKSGENEVFIGGDPGSLIAAHSLARRKKGTLIYWSLELYIEKHLSNFGLRVIKRRERKCNQHALCTVDFGDIRCKILQEENGLDPRTMISVPNSQIGRGEIVRNYLFNDKFNIARNKVIILHAGGLFGHWLHVKDIFRSIPEWPEDYVLVLHTHQRPYPMCGFSIPEEYLNRKIFLSDDPVPFDQLDMVYSSCDIGIMLHGPAGNDLDKNLYYSDLSVGKIFHHLKVGVPIIVRNLPGYPELIEGRQAGVCINDPSDILPAIQRIMNNHEQYRLNALKLHEEFRFELYHMKVIERLNALPR
jgi:glycosyltransferase involved in cell wall biosynthesis